MIKDSMDWVDKKAEEQKAAQAEGYFNFEEGDNRIQLLTHCAPLAQKWTGTKYEPAEEGDTNVSIKGVCWVLQNGKIKQAKLPYVVVKQIRAYQSDEDWYFEEFPMSYPVNIRATGAGTKEVEYTVVPSPKKIEIPQYILDELKDKPTPEEIVEKIKNKDSAKASIAEIRNQDAEEPAF